MRERMRSGSERERMRSGNEWERLRGRDCMGEYERERTTEGELVGATVGRESDGREMERRDRKWTVRGERGDGTEREGGVGGAELGC